MKTAPRAGRGLGMNDSESTCRPGWEGVPCRSFSVESVSGKPKKLVVDGPEELFIDEEDISRLLQAKAAITAGLRIALRRSALNMMDIDLFFLAGAFGTYLSLDSAVEIGLLPALNHGEFIRLGNASIEGATIALLSSESRKELEKAVGRIIHLELESEPDFFELYTDGCLLERI